MLNTPVFIILFIHCILYKYSKFVDSNSCLHDLISYLAHQYFLLMLYHYNNII